ncbi:G-PROTEIN-RECEP-F1-2 domain-containing protein [Aphelenchoides besseyi]|nr:G-PROTEIN-RECEP-F1-2 domain-containing protein [Aphelenchoides besseyi]
MSLDQKIAEMLQFSNQYYMNVNIFIMVIQGLSIITNGFIIILFISSKRLQRNTALRLILLLCVTDWLFAVTTIPYVVQYIVNWNAVEFNYDGILVITLSLPLTVQFKVNLIITTAIALDRYQAMHFSMHYRTKNHNLFVFYTLLLGIILSLVDVYFEYALDPLPVNTKCAAVGCFTSLKFRLYWGSTNLALSFVLLFITALVGRELCNLNQPEVLSNPEAKPDQNANRLSMAILIIALTFQTIPSMLVGISDLFGLNSFQKLGPFYIVGLLLCGLCNSIVYIALHLELKTAAKRFLRLIPNEIKVATVSYSTPHSRMTRFH